MPGEEADSQTVKLMEMLRLMLVLTMLTMLTYLGWRVAPVVW